MAVQEKSELSEAVKRPKFFTSTSDQKREESQLKMRSEGKNINMFWGQGGNHKDWEEWLRDKGLIGGGSGKQEGRSANGWTDPNDDLSDAELEEEWESGGMKRPGEKENEGFSDDEELDDDWDDDDDDHGGQMMPIPGI